MSMMIALLEWIAIAETAEAYRAANVSRDKIYVRLARQRRKVEEEEKIQTYEIGNDNGN